MSTSASSATPSNALCQLPTYQVIAALLDYPQAELLAALPELRAALQAEELLSRQGLEDIQMLCDYLGRNDLYTLQENYVSLFDRGRGYSLHLFEHVHGESRDRGQAMVDLQRLYAGKGLYLAASELPDYLPVFLEFLSRQSRSEAHTLLSETAHILQALGERLAKWGSHYHYALYALLSLCGEKPVEVEFVARDGESEADDYQAIDAAWAEEPITFGGGTGCPSQTATSKNGEAVIQFQPRSRPQPATASVRPDSLPGTGV
ncbi:MAG: nitrate reductase molybdenum cofactor assembly chaperone [Herbaspirillum sp.]